MERQGLRSHLSGSVPISIGIHLVAILAFLIIPLTAVDVLDPYREPLDYIPAIPAPPPPPVAIRTAPRASTAVPQPSVTAIPTSAPQAIAPEAAPPGPPSDLPVSDTGGLPPDLGAIGSVGGPPIVAPPPPPKPAGPVRMAELPVPPRKVVDVRPVYPDAARHARQEGTVVLEAVLDPTGSVTQVRVVRSVPLLDQAAIDAVRRWKYTPTIYGGHPVSVLMTITIRFTLQPS
jgi:protein TonB